MLCITLLIILSYILLIKKHKIQLKDKNRVFNAKEGDKVLLVTAHPDDECMFFSPTILYLLDLKCQIILLCLSNGDYDGLGEERAYELYRSCENFGIPLGNVSISSHFNDDPNVFWDPKDICKTIENQVLKLKSYIFHAMLLFWPLIY